MNYTRTGYRIKYYLKIADETHREKLFWEMLNYKEQDMKSEWDYYSTKLTVLLCWERF